MPLPVFQNNMKSNIDWQAWELISRQKGEFAYIAKPLMCHRIHEHSTTSELLEVNVRQEEDLFMFRKFLAGTGGEADQPAVQEQRKVKQKHVTHNPVREDE